jgi:probable rRNA maturation factor
MKILNNKYRGVDKTTDVLSFPQLEYQTLKKNKKKHNTTLLLVDIVINIQKALQQAKQNNISLNEEIKKLLIHGLLHLLGYNHEKNSCQRKIMKDKEKELFKVTSD